MTVLKGLAAIHDWVSKVSFALAASVLAFISVAYCYEVASRYFFNSPTVWASPLVSYGLCLTIFLALPDLTRRGLHVSIDLHESLPPWFVAGLFRVTTFVSGVACLFGAWITAEQSWSEFGYGVWTNTYVPIPKWWLFIFIPYGFLGGGLFFLRQAFGETSHQTEENVT
jgi:C4-dicarboxylate transporter DctQ subunit